MPAPFLKCAASGGKIRTLKLKGRKYMHVCVQGGKSYPGEVKTRKAKK